jgi:hypothetical protein
MSEKEHKQELITLMDDIMSEIDLKPLHPKNKLLLYSRYLLSKRSWHFTVTTLSITWVSENMDSVVNKYVRKWLEIPISGTLSNVYLTSNKFGLKQHLKAKTFSATFTPRQRKSLKLLHPDKKTNCRII